MRIIANDRALDDICLAEFIKYTSAPKDTSETNNDECKTKRSSASEVTLKDNGAIMRPREVPRVLRLHEPRKNLKITNSYIPSVCCTCPGKMKSYIVIHLKHQLNCTKTTNKNFNKNKLKNFPLTRENDLIDECLTSMNFSVYRT